MKNIEIQKIASAGTIEALQKLINEYHYSTSFTIETDLTVWNSKGLFIQGSVKKVKNRFIYYIK